MKQVESDANLQENAIAFTDKLREAVPFRMFEVAMSIQYDTIASQALGKDYWRVLDAFKYYVGDRSQDTWVHVPAGYLTDGATVPRPFWSIIPPWGNYGQAAVVHDFLCETSTLYVQGVATKIERKQTDRIFLEAMEVAGVGRVKRYLMYYAVRAWAIGRGILGLKPPRAKIAQKQIFESNWNL